MHGLSRKTKIIVPDFLFEKLPNEFNSGRYHSWVVDKNNLPVELEITAVDNNDEPMALRHKKYNVRGVQFHPESILTEYGEQIIFNWVNS